MTRQIQKKSTLRTRVPKKYADICSHDLGIQDEISININTQQIVIMKNQDNLEEDNQAIKGIFTTN